MQSFIISRLADPLVTLARQDSFRSQIKSATDNVRGTKVKPFKECPESIDTLIKKMSKKYEDPWYKECDGIYIVYQGKVDLVDSKNKKHLFTFGLFDHFGESRIVERPSYEDLGDFYAGFNRVTTTADLKKEKAQKHQLSNFQWSDPKPSLF